MAEPYHVLYLLHSLGRGGTENGVVNLINRMDPKRFRFTLALIKRDREMLDRVDRVGIPVVTVGRRWGNDPLFPIKLMTLFRRLKPDLVHTRGFSCIEGVASARLGGVPAVIHSEHGRDADEVHRMKIRRAALRRVLYRMTDLVVTVSEELRNSILAQVKTPADKIACLPNGVDLRRFRSLPRKETARRELGLPSDATVIGSVGRHDPVKDYGSLLRAFARIRSQRKGVRLLLAGDGPQNAALRNAADALGIAGDVHFLGWSDDIQNILAATDVFVLPSLTEGMSNALLEAMAAGLPCVATEVGGNGELIDQGTTGLLVPPSNPERLGAALERLVSNAALRQQMGEAGRARVTAQFSLDAMVARYEDLYLGAIEKRLRTPLTPVLPPVPVAPTSVRSEAKVGTK